MSEKAQAAIAAAAEAKRQQAAGLRKVAPWISLEIHRDLVLDQAKALEGEAVRLNDEAGATRPTSRRRQRTAERRR